MIRDFIVKILIKLKLYGFVVDCINRVKLEIQARKMKKDGKEMLHVADEIMSSMGIRAFLTYGTLLGAVREKGFISYDPDIDLGVLYSEMDNRWEEVHNAMKKADFQLYKQSYYKETGDIIEETYIYKGLHLDLFFYFEEGEDLYSVVAGRHESKEWKEANESDGFPNERSYVSKTDFEKSDFLGLKVYMPVKTHEWLTALYSDSYMTPIKNWSEDGYKTRRVKKENDRSYRRYF